ncbi:hypothetical protein NC651_019192 [Populus alba x Populus x berolinensis]|nr:hypothetical protein NC651_019192 [Populus alba x Populus x berolinensis]
MRRLWMYYQTMLAKDSALAYLLEKFKVDGKMPVNT